MKPRRSLSSWHFITARNKALDGPWFKRKENRHDQSILSMILKVENLVDGWWRISIGPLSCSDRLDKWHDWHGISMHYWNSKMLFRSTGHRGKYLQGRLVQGAGLPLRSAWLQRWDRWLAGRNSSTRIQQAQQCIQTDFLYTLLSILFASLICSIITQYIFWCTKEIFKFLFSPCTRKTDVCRFMLVSCLPQVHPELGVPGLTVKFFWASSLAASPKMAVALRSSATDTLAEFLPHRCCYHYCGRGVPG